MAAAVTRPSVLVFDLGGVLVDTSGFDRLNELLGTPIALSALKDAWLVSPAVRRFELGISSPEEFARSLVGEWGLACQPRDFLAEFAAWPKGLYPGVTELLTQLRQRYKVVCLSNSNVLHWARMRGFLEHFHLALSSHLLGLIKPDPACFNRALQECGVPATAVAFFDDSLANVVSARALGIRGIHVSGFAQVERAARAFMH